MHFFWNLVSGWKHFETALLGSLLDSESTFFAYRWCHRPTPRPLSLTPLPLVTTTTTADYILVFVLQKILSLLGLQGQKYYAALLLHWAHIILDPSRRAFSFYCLFVYSAQDLCAGSISSSPFWWISSAIYRPGIWTKVCWVINNGSIWNIIFFKRCQGRGGGVDMALNLYLNIQMNYQLANQVFPEH